MQDVAKAPYRPGVQHPKAQKYSSNRPDAAGCIYQKVFVQLVGQALVLKWTDIISKTQGLSDGSCCFVRRCHPTAHKARCHFQTVALQVKMGLALMVI